MDAQTLVDARRWSEATFGRCALGDVRRTRRVVEIGGRLAAHGGHSLAGACAGAAGAQEGAYRLIRNDHVEAAAILEGGFAATVEAAGAHARLLAVEDTTELSYRHGVAQDLGDLGGKADRRSRGMWAHSVLLVDADSERTVGLVEQSLWQRASAQRGAKHRRRQRAYAQKESYKWQRASERVAQRLGARMAQVIAVCDREADVFEYLQYKHRRGERFIVRAAQDRCLWQDEARLFAAASHGANRGRLRVHVPQRGGRVARDATLHLKSTSVTLDVPRNGAHRTTSPMTVNVVLAEEAEARPDRLCWLLLTSEPIGSRKQVQDVLRCYGLRWRIEEFHKAWKSGVGVEQLRMQRRSNLLRMAAVLAFVAVRLLQLREVLDRPDRARQPCVSVLADAEWKMLWVSVHPHRPLPDAPPDLAWAYRALAQLGGFTDTKRTGRAGWQTLWEGWFRLHQRVDGYRLLQSAVS